MISLLLDCFGKDNIFEGPPDREEDTQHSRHGGATSDIKFLSLAVTAVFFYYFIFIYFSSSFSVVLTVPIEQLFKKKLGDITFIRLFWKG